MLVILFKGTGGKEIVYVVFSLNEVAAGRLFFRGSLMAATQLAWNLWVHVKFSYFFYNFFHSCYTFFSSFSPFLSLFPSSFFLFFLSFSLYISLPLLCSILILLNLFPFLLFLLWSLCDCRRERNIPRCPRTFRNNPYDDCVSPARPCKSPHFLRKLMKSYVGGWTRV